MRFKLLVFFCCFSSTVFAQRFLTDMMDTTSAFGKGLYNLYGAKDKFRIAGYMQPQFQIAQSKGAKGFEGGDFAAQSNSRFMMRRGRLRLDYSHYSETNKPLAYMVFQFDYSERGVYVRDFFGRFFENKLELFSLTTGIFARPMGYELNLGSSDRESPERGRMSQTIMKIERDIGAMITFDPRKKSFPIQWLKAEIGMFNGQGLNGTTDYDSHKDVIGRLSLKPRTLNKKAWILSAATSCYWGGITNQSDQLARLSGTGADAHYTIDSSANNMGKLAARKYFGADAQLKIPNKKGATEFRAEFMLGQQTGTFSSSETPGVYPTQSNNSPQTLYTRHFSGAYFYFLQHLGTERLQFVLKYDWYDPNTDVKGMDIAANKGFSPADIKYSTIGTGLVYYINAHVRSMLYYSNIKNESTQLDAYTSDVKDNVLTMRIQYRF